jgi:hypothetical protein
MRRAAAVLAGLVLLAGCGGGKDGDDPGGDDRSEPAAKTGADGRASDERQAADVAVEYVRSLVAEDWKAVCATRTEKERRELAKLAGTCESGMRAAFADRPVDVFEGVRAGDVRIRGDVAAVDLVQPGQKDPAITVSAVRENGRWLLENVPEEKLP